MESVELVKEITATMTLRLPGTVGKIANKMRYIDAKAPQFLRGQVIRPIPHGQFDQVKAVGIASVSNHLPAFGGVLYGAAALRHDVSVIGNKVVDTFQDSRIDINDMNYLVTRQRLTWKEYLLVYQLLDDLFSESKLPDIILLDIPLLVARAQQTGRLEDEAIEEEWREVMNTMTTFWERNLSKIFPEDPGGPMLVSLSTRHFGAVLNAIREKGDAASPEPIEPEAVTLISQEWGRLREVGIMRTLQGMLRGGKRTSAYYYDALGKEVLRAEPKIVSSYGLIGLHARIGIRTPIWQLETLGNKENGIWTSAELDRLCSMIAYLTLHDHPDIAPLPLWYARMLVEMPKAVLVSYLKETFRLLREQTVDAAWLEGVDALDENADKGVNL
jgi:hypothetical protein